MNPCGRDLDFSYWPLHVLNMDKNSLDWHKECLGIRISTTKRVENGAAVASN